MVCVTAASPTTALPAVKRPNTTAIGVIVWLGSEVMFFAGLFAIYFTLRAMAPEQFAAGHDIMNIPFASINTSILVLSSVTCQFGVFAAEHSKPRATGWSPAKWGTIEWFYATVVLGSIFVGGQVWEYATLVSEGYVLNLNAFTSTFYMSTGFHGLHVTGGLIVFLIVIGRIYAARRMGHREATSAICISYYWHFVDVVWIGLFFVIYILPFIS
ncbi:cytochrome b561 [Pseudoclavibacter endophyticus]|uniref:cytochrome-c oxidase n=1 Tax=Pseudoclavibacter endophyticus TaxID=1778590 RepID=A0A6H9WWL5_9MICO|nr:heme-copper oxidase subunit III [Pseudoclavibacter endophyticus]KAB1650580.1 heme-copper oxidase subunit III [Pseudoclavibacter endophyticus]GGA56021.1 cytochrome b561 [Pseudoclavibacter endophyticus]